ncbi:efflux RND transporter periplasmic adaptor subunit, partial [Salinispira pacifica]
KSTPTSNDLAQAESQLRQAQLTLQSAQASLDGMQSLSEQGLASAQQLLDARRQLDGARAAVDGARYNLDQVRAGPTADVMQAQLAAVSSALSSYQRAKIILDAASIRTPVAGTVAQVGVNPGDLVSATSVVQVSSTGTNEVNSANAICVVIQNNPAVLQALVDETDVARIRVGQKAVVTPAAYPNQRLTGTVSAIAQQTSTQQNVTTLAVSISVPNPDGRLLWGMNADAEIAVLSRPDVLQIPNAALHRAGRSATVELREGDKIVTRTVETGASNGSMTEITSGLEEGDQIVVPRVGGTLPSQGQRGQNFMFRALR